MENTVNTTSETKKKRVLSMIQPTGMFTLGNYLGALKNFVALQNDYECVYALADLHAITVRQNPAEFRKNTLSAYAMMLALGIDPEQEFGSVNPETGLAEFRQADGSYAHLLTDTEGNLMATEQAMLALCALERLPDGGCVYESKYREAA